MVTVFYFLKAFGSELGKNKLVSEMICVVVKWLLLMRVPVSTLAVFISMFSEYNFLS